MVREQKARGVSRWLRWNWQVITLFFHFEVQYKISIIRTINYPCKMANVHPCQVECTLMAFTQTENVKIWSLLMVLQERVITAWSKLICFLPDELLYFIAGWHFKVIMALLTPDNFSCSVVLGDPHSHSLSVSVLLARSHSEWKSEA